MTIPSLVPQHPYQTLPTSHTLYHIILHSRKAGSCLQCPEAVPSFLYHPPQISSMGRDNFSSIFLESSQSPHSPGYPHRLIPENNHRVIPEM